VNHLVERDVAKPLVIAPVGGGHLQVFGARDAERAFADLKEVGLLELPVAVVEDVGDLDLRAIVELLDQPQILLFDRRRGALGRCAFGLVEIEPDARARLRRLQQIDVHPVELVPADLVLTGGLRIDDVLLRVRRKRCQDQRRKGCRAESAHACLRS